METPQFKEWFQSVFLKHCNTLDGSKLLIFDGHLSHITLEIVEIANENNISIIVLPPHTTNFLQPLDVAVFKPMKTEWRKVVGDYLENNSFENLKTEIFPKLLKTLHESGKAFLRRHAVAGFEATGIYPLNRTSMLKHAIDDQTSDDEDEVFSGEKDKTRSEEKEAEEETEREEEISDDAYDIDADQGKETADEDEETGNTDKSTKEPLLHKWKESALPLEDRIKLLQNQIDAYEERQSQKSTSSDTSSNLINSFGSSVKNVLKPIINSVLPNKKIKRSYAECITSDEAQESLKSERVERVKKLELQNRMNEIKVQKEEVRLATQKLAFEKKQKLDIEKREKEIEKIENKKQKDIEKAAKQNQKNESKKLKDIEKGNGKKKQMLKTK